MKTQKLSYCGVRKVSFKRKIWKFSSFLLIPFISSCVGGQGSEYKANNKWTQDSKGNEIASEIKLWLYDEEKVNKEAKEANLETTGNFPNYAKANNLYLFSQPICNDFKDLKFTQAFKEDTIFDTKISSDYDFAFQTIADLSSYKARNHENTDAESNLFYFNFSPKQNTRLALTFYDLTSFQSGSKNISFTFEISLLIGYKNKDDDNTIYKEINLNNTGNKVSKISCPDSSTAYNVIWELNPNNVSSWKSGIADDPDPTKSSYMERNYMKLIIKEKNNNKFTIG